MRHLFSFSLLSAALVSAAISVSCRHVEPDNTSDVSAALETAPLVMPEADTTSLGESPAVAPEPAQPVTPKVRTNAPKPSEKLYVTGYDGKGSVWGVVTMQGDKGSGVIHDAEENHYNITCTRHGDELFAIDHNSRQYVLKF